MWGEERREGREGGKEERGREEERRKEEGKRVEVVDEGEER